MMSKKAFTLLEVLVGSIIIAAVFGGVIASFISIRTYIRRANKRLITVNLLRHVGDSLYGGVDAVNWDAAVLNLGAHANALPVNPTAIDGLNYGGSYNVTAVAGRDYRQVSIAVTYPDP